VKLAPVAKVTAANLGARGLNSSRDIELVAEAGDVDGMTLGGAIARVDFYVDGKLIGSDVHIAADDKRPQFPMSFGRDDFKFVWKGAATGRYSITAIATDTFGLSSPASEPLIVTVK
jgi:hypothetical protein